MDSDRRGLARCADRSVNRLRCGAGDSVATLYVVRATQACSVMGITTAGKRTDNVRSRGHFRSFKFRVKRAVLGRA